MAPALWAALGALAAFYPAVPEPKTVLLAGLSLGGAAVPLHCLPGRAFRMAPALFALSFGLVLGASARLAESAYAAPAEILRFRTTEVSGSLASDSRRTSSGNSVVSVGVSGLSFDFPGAKASLSWPRRSPRVSLVVDTKSDFYSGQRMDASGISAIAPESALFFAPKAKLSTKASSSIADEVRGSLRKLFSARIKAVSGDSFPLAQALLLGNKDEIDGVESALFRDAGCAHILSLSGQHLSILCMLMTILFEKGLKRPRLAKAASLLFALSFSWLAGSGPSLLRACLMTLLGIAAGRADRPQRSLCVLSSVFCIALALKPADARSLSFVLSYAAMLGLILLSSRWENLLWRLPPPLAKALSPSLAAILATAPLSLGVFGRVPTGGIVAATLSGPVVLLFMWSLLAASVLGSPLPFLNPFLSSWHQAVHAVLLAVMRLGARFPAIVPETKPEAALLSSAVVLLGLFVYDYPYCESAFFTTFRSRRLKSSPAGKAMTISYDSPSYLKDFLESKGLAMSKRFGQNFLVDRNARLKLVGAIGAADCRAGEEGKGSSIWEIGPGIGSITSLLVEAGHGVTAFEIDHGFVRVLAEIFGSLPGFSIVEGDFLKTWKSALASGRPDVIFGNLPYNAALAIIADLLEYPWVPPRIVFTIQKEAARRIAASPGTKDYSAFSVLCSSVCRTTILYDISHSAFWPQPRVTSSVVLLEPRPEPIAGDDRLGFSRFVRSSFSSRRKTLRNNLIAYDKAMAAKLDQALAALGLPAEVRAEALSPEALAQVYSAVKSR